MSHLNKQLEVHPGTLEHYLAEQNRRKRNENRLDRFGLGLMIFCGCIGLLYCISHANSILSKKENSSQGVQMANGNLSYASVANWTNPNYQSTGIVLEENSSSQEFVSIQGMPRVGEKLYFTLDDYDPKAVYEFNFGNGERQRIQSNQMVYSYDMPGSYDVVLNVSYQGETAVAFTKTLTINY